MSLINHPGSHHQMAVIGIDAGHARDIMLMLTDAHALISDLADGAAPAAARQAAAVLRDADSACTLDSLAGALFRGNRDQAVRISCASPTPLLRHRQHVHLLGLNRLQFPGIDSQRRKNRRGDLLIRRRYPDVGRIPILLRQE